MHMRWLPRLTLALGLTTAALLLPVACGGASQNAKSGESGSEGGEWEEGDSLPHCADGTCYACGEGFCPVGYYCDEGAPRGAACSWLPECADEATCSCVLGVLGNECSCDERDDGIYVSCS